MAALGSNFRLFFGDVEITGMITSVQIDQPTLDVSTIGSSHIQTIALPKLDMTLSAIVDAVITEKGRNVIDEWQEWF